jgi:outer membrane lipoprotein SlyB
MSLAEVEMKKGLVSIVCLLALTFAAIPVGAQTRNRRHESTRSSTRSATRYNQANGSAIDNQVYQEAQYQNEVYNDPRYGDYTYGRGRSVWERSRDKITTAAGAGAGAIIGGLIGGKKGALIGAIAGGGGAALYTYKIRNKNYRY